MESVRPAREPGQTQADLRWLAAICLAGALARLAAAAYLGDRVVPTPSAFDQVYFHDVALNLLAGRGFVFTQPPWDFIRPGMPTAYTSFVYQLFLAGIYVVAGPHPLVARIVQALVCSLMPWQVYLLTRRIVAGIPGWAGRAATVGLVAAAISAGYAYFVYFSATLMTEGVYLMVVIWVLIQTLELAEQPTRRGWVLWGLATGFAILLRQVFMPVAGLSLVYVAWRAGRRVRPAHVLLAGAIVAALILPWTVRNYSVFGRFLLLNSQAGQVFWNANHPDLGDQWERIAMFPVPADLTTANEAELNDELMKRGLALIAADPGRFARLSLSRLVSFFLFWPLPRSSLFSNISRTLSFGICLPFMLGGLLWSLRAWRAWLLLYLFAGLYTLVHVMSWVQIRYRMPVDVVLVPFAAVAVVALVGAARRAWRTSTTGAASSSFPLAGRSE